MVQNKELTSLVFEAKISEFPSPMDFTADLVECESFDVHWSNVFIEQNK
jgi:hypothetical protein